MTRGKTTIEALNFRKILIANRGEIACRIIRTAKKMGIISVCVYSEADINALFIRMSDEAYPIGPAPSSESYLNIEKICEIAQQANCDAVHPGYGFLAENHELPKRLKELGIAFIGPSAESIAAMGDKIESKKIARNANVNVVPGYMGTIKSIKEAKKIIASIGLPVIIKAAAGGGGKGMRIVRNQEEIEQSFESATNEAVKNFRDGRLFIEKYIETPRHIEIQILQDKYGNAVCIGERECSIQRNNQKIVEETPSTFVTPEMRETMYVQCRKLIEKVSYYSAGTIEFVVDKNRNFYFLEMNTRLQVEHPVTEMVTGIDLVEEMINIAQGKKLSFSQRDIKFQGNAIEVRICAEDPSKRFLPSTGRISIYSEPSIDTNLRIDSGVTEGSTVSMFYDAMIAKLCSYGPNRMSAIANMQSALEDFMIEGITTNLDFLSSIVRNVDFISGNTTTAFIDTHYPKGFAGDPLTEDCRLTFICAVLVIKLKFECNDRQASARDMEVHVDTTSHTLHVKQDISGKISMIYNHNVIAITDVNLSAYSHLLSFKINGERRSIKMEKIGAAHYELRHAGMFAQCAAYDLHVASLLPIMKTRVGKGRNKLAIETPITGLMVRICVDKGDTVSIGQTLFIVEAMKMENYVLAESDATIKEVLAKEGTIVSAGEVVLRLKNPE